MLYLPTYMPTYICDSSKTVVTVVTVFTVLTVLTEVTVVSSEKNYATSKNNL